MGFEQTNRHIHDQFYHISFLPCTVHFRIGICLGIHGHRLTVHYQRSFPTPFGNTEEEGESTCFTGHFVQRYTYITFPRIVRFLHQSKFPLIFPVCSQCICTVQVAINPFRTQCISIILRLTKRTQCIGRTTETTDIFRPFFRPTECIRQIGTDTKRIRIEILLSIQAYATQYTIIKASFHKLRILGISRHFQHAPVEQHITNVGTSFVMCRTVRQLIRTTVALMHFLNAIRFIARSIR